MSSALHSEYLWFCSTDGIQTALPQREPILLTCKWLAIWRAARSQAAQIAVYPPRHTRNSPFTALQIPSHFSFWIHEFSWAILASSKLVIRTQKRDDSAKDEALLSLWCFSPFSLILNMIENILYSSLWLLFYYLLFYFLRGFYRHCIRRPKNLEVRYSNPNVPVWACVTGATSGIGLVFARELASRGFNILLVSRSEKKLKDV